MRNVEYKTSRILYKDENKNLSRKDGPSSIFFNGSTLWKQDGCHLRPDGGPTFIHDDGCIMWQDQNGNPYRILYADGTTYYKTGSVWDREDLGHG